MFLEKEGGVTKSEMPRENEFPVFSYEETQSGISRLWNGIGPGLELKTTRFSRFEQFLTPSKASLSPRDNFFLFKNIFFIVVKVEISCEDTFNQFSC